MSITYQVKGDTPSQEDMDDTVYKLQRRVEAYSSEAQAYQREITGSVSRFPGVQDANEILSELGQPGSLYFIRHYGSDGSENYTLNADGTGYELTKTIESCRMTAPLSLSGSDVENATAGTYQHQTTGATMYAVDLVFNEEGTQKFADATEEAYNNGSDSIAIYYDGELDQCSERTECNRKRSGADHRNVRHGRSIPACVNNPYRRSERGA